MNLIVPKMNKKGKIIADVNIPLAKNVLIRDPEDGSLIWKTKNNNWCSWLGTSSIITNIQIDETPHSPDLWLYCHGGQFLHLDDRKIENTIRLNMATKWYIRQLSTCYSKIGIYRFSMLPLKVWLRYWRKPIPIDALKFHILATSAAPMENVAFLVKVSILPNDVYDKLTTFNMYVRWPELAAAFRCEIYKISNDPHSIFEPKDWISTIKNIIGDDSIVLLSDYDTMFNNDADEMCYITDIRMKA